MYLALGLCVSVYSLVLLLGTREVSQWNLAQHRVVHARVSWYWSHLHLVSSAPEHVLQRQSHSQWCQVRQIREVVFQTLS